MKYKVFGLFFCFTLLASAQQKPSQQWLDQKFSMFIHFGLYSAYGGVYEGKPVERGYSEQIQSFAGIFSDWYGNTAKQFNPTKWNPDEIVQLAKDAGMRSIVFTSKHHDGFCMYHSQYTDFNIVDATPYGRDLMKELAGACKRGGIDFAVYFSLIDWNYPHAYPISSHNADPLTDEHYEFNKKQVEEIMTNYGDISEIWFDMGSLTNAQSKGLYELVNRLQPQCMISGRLGNDYVDFSVMADNEYPDYKLGIPWQTAASMFNETWGYRSWQKRGSVQDKVNEKITSLVKVISRGGNYLLNIGLRGDGSVVEFERDVLLEMGKWIKINSEAIYGTAANPFNHTYQWGDITTKNEDLYLFVKNDFIEESISISGFKSSVSEVKVLGSNELCDFYPPKIYYGDWHIHLPKTTYELPFTVLKVSFKNDLVILPKTVTNGVLTPQNSNPVFGHSSLNYYCGYKSLIGYNWTFSTRKRQVVPEIMFSENEIGREITVEIDDNKQNVILNSSSKKTVRLAQNTVQWNNMYRKCSSMIFGRLTGLEGNPNITPDDKWTKISQFPYGKTLTEEISPKSGIVFLQDIESTKEQQIAIEIKSGNALYILLNGEYITAHFSPDRVDSGQEIVFLPLKKGNNQLVIVFYNGFAKEFSYKIEPLQQWTVYTQKLSSLKLYKEKHFHTFSVRDANPISNVAPLRMNNIKIKL
ncbi:MAG: hypothetical protein GX311_08950 [Bacteroidales bacterium]|jgi:alpha-L-fucosidase|nr:hypothetical protein [Bacteroidales bacterium]